MTYSPRGAAGCIVGCGSTSGFCLNDQYCDSNSHTCKDCGTGYGTVAITSGAQAFGNNPTVVCATKKSYTGDVQKYTVPASGVTALRVDLFGAQGVDYDSSHTGGYGGYVSTLIPVTPNQDLYIYVGGSALGYNGGGNTYSSYQNFGGGATDIRTRNNLDLFSRIAVAGMYRYTFCMI